VPSNCRDILQIILAVCHRTAVCDDILDEWRGHSSKFARRWRVSMRARRKVATVTPADCSDVASALRAAPGLSDRQIAAGEKDLHLIATARSAEQVIISQDDTARDIFRRLSLTTGAVANLSWVNPVLDFEVLRAWLNEEGPPAPDWQLTSASVTRGTRRGKFRRRS
jgi:hypothetical protein